jgi:two-component system, OmpR family, response regulator
MRRGGQQVSRDAIEHVLTSEDGDIAPNTVEKVVSRLRAALASEQAGIQIKTIRGFGYQLEASPCWN